MLRRSATRVFRRTAALRVASGPAKRHPLEVLELKDGATKEEIKKAYRALMQRYHPDTAKDGKGDNEKFQEAHEAFELLRKHEWKVPSEYEQFRRNGGIFHDGEQQAADSWAGGQAPQGDYVSGHLKQYIKIALAWCVLYGTARFLLTALFPPKHPLGVPVQSGFVQPAPPVPAGVPAAPSGGTAGAGWGFGAASPASPGGAGYDYTAGTYRSPYGVPMTPTTPPPSTGYSFTSEPPMRDPLARS